MYHPRLPPGSLLLWLASKIVEGPTCLASGCQIQASLQDADEHCSRQCSLAIARWLHSVCHCAGGAQAEHIAEYLQDSMHFADVKVRIDLRGINRFITARR